MLASARVQPGCVPKTWPGPAEAAMPRAPAVSPATRAMAPAPNSPLAATRGCVLPGHCPERRPRLVPSTPCLGARSSGQRPGQRGRWLEGCSPPRPKPTALARGLCRGAAPPSSRAEGLLFPPGLESNPESSLQTEEEARHLCDIFSVLLVVWCEASALGCVGIWVQCI